MVIMDYWGRKLSTQMYNIIHHIKQILDGSVSNIQFTGWRKVILDKANPSPISLF